MFRLPPLTPFVRKLLIALFAIFVLIAIAEWQVDVLPWLVLETRQLQVATLWTIFTYVLVVPVTAVFPFFISLLFIWLILPPFEERYGAPRTIQLAIVATLCSGVAALAVGLLLPQYATPIYGPQTITLAAIAASAVLMSPHAEISFFGVMPMRAGQLLWVVLGFSVLQFLVSHNVASLGSDVGAIGGGVAFVKWWMQRPPRRRTFTRKPGKPSKLRVVRSDEDPPRGGWLN